ncbi:MAG: hypothetical protein JJU42_08135 [Rhodobacteraceae bacterium]|nr:hypothetical protein [Paracoccaceae bacterium]
MPRQPATVKQSDVTRIIKGAQAAGIVAGRIEADLKTGRVVVYAEGQASADDPNPWDRL